MNRVDLSIVIPAYNEENVISDTVHDIHRYVGALVETFEIIVADDGSADQTLQIVDKIAAELTNVRTCHYDDNRGKGHAVRTGALASEGELVLFTDADHATPIQELPAFLDAIAGGFDIAIGSRAVPGAVREVHQPAYREWGGRALNFLIRMLAVPGVADTQCGFKLFTKDAARRVFSRCILDGFSFDVETLYLARKMSCKVAELPVRWSHHEGSRVRPFRDGLMMIADIVRIRFHDYQLDQAGIDS